MVITAVQTWASLKHEIQNSGKMEYGITEYHVKMADDPYVNKCCWHEFLPREVISSNEAKGNGYIDKSSKVVRAEMLLQMKIAAKCSFLADKLKKVTAQPTIGSASMNPSSTQRGEPHPRSGRASSYPMS